MNSINNISSTKWVICHNEVDVFHIVKLEVGSKLETGQPFVEQFDTEQELETRINTLTNNPKWYENYKANK